MYKNNIDILENELIKKYPGVLDALLRDHTTQKNIFWATDNYKELGDNYQYHSEIIPESISGDNGNVIMPRVKKNKELQQSRIREMAEVFTVDEIIEHTQELNERYFTPRRQLLSIRFAVSFIISITLFVLSILMPKFWKYWLNM